MNKAEKELDDLFWSGYRAGKRRRSIGILSGLPYHKPPRYVNGFAEGQLSGFIKFNNRHRFIKFILNLIFN